MKYLLKRYRLKQGKKKELDFGSPGFISACGHYDDNFDYDGLYANALLPTKNMTFQAHEF